MEVTKFHIEQRNYLSTNTKKQMKGLFHDRNKKGEYMKVEIEIPDLEEIYYSCDEEGVTPKDFKEAIVEVAIEKFIDKMYDSLQFPLHSF